MASRNMGLLINFNKDALIWYGGENCSEPNHLKAIAN